MAESELNGRNIVLQIKNADGTPFHNLVLHKSTVDSVVMSLGDKITGDVYYKDNTLDVSMGEYITFNDVDYVLINPPTIVKEGMVSDNSDLNGMTKYSFTFYHPMCMLGNFPFSDVAVSSDEEKYKSQDKAFAWIGTPDDYIAKLNKNLQNTTWVVVKSDRFPEEKDGELSDVLTFDNDTIADALKIGYDTWDVPYIIDKLHEGEYYFTNNNNQRVDYYSDAGGSKRFVIVFGLPSNEIYETSDDETQDNPFVFHYGQGVGLKNNSCTPRNNKIVTRIAAYGSEDNIPYGYPQIIWYGNPDWEYTAYSQIVTQRTITKGQYTVDVGIMVTEEKPEYEESIRAWQSATNGTIDGIITHDTHRSKTSGDHQYEWSVTIKNNYVAAKYIIANESYERKFYLTNSATMFDVFVPEDSTPAEGAYTLYWGIVGGAYMLLIHHPYTRHHLMPSIYSQCVFNKVSPYVSGGGANPDYDPTIELVDYYDAISDSEHQYPNPIVPNSPSYESHQFEDIKPELGYNIAIVDAYPINNDGTRADDWDSTMNDDGEYIQSYFKLTLPILSFDIYACAAITQEMTLVMRSGACLGCSFPVQVDWEDYKMNFYDEDGNFAPDGSQRNLEKYPKSNEEQITVIVQKDLDTFGTLMPNVYQKVSGESSTGAGDGDTFVVIGISLPLSYITNAEERLDEEAKSYMLENNLHYFDYPLKFDEFFLANNINILQQIRPNTIVRFEYAGNELELFVKQLTIKYGNAPLPQYDITLTDDVEVSLNQIGQVAEDVERLSTLIALLRQTYSRNVWAEIDKKLSRVANDTANGLITFLQGIRLGKYQQLTSGGMIDSSGNGELNTLLVRDDTIIGGRTYQRGDIEFGQDGFMSGVKGGAVYQDDEKNIHAEFDYLNIRKKMNVSEVEIQEANYVGGSIVVTPANGIVITHVQDDDTQGLLRCYYNAGDTQGGEYTKPTWRVGDLAYSQSWNFMSSIDESDGDESDANDISHFWWRLCYGAILDDDEESEHYGEYYLLISTNQGEYASLSDIPKVGDKVVMLGHIKQNDETQEDASKRQGAIMIAAAGGEADIPYIRVFNNIHEFSLESATLVHQISYNGLITNTKNWNLNIDLGTGTVVNKTFNQVYGEIDSIAQQLDQSFSVWQGSDTTTPTLSNYPASQWGTISDPYSEHVGDFYITSDGICYKFVESGSTYAWALVTDQYLIKYVTQIGEKKRVFVTQPSNSAVYDVGDLWAQAVYPGAGEPDEGSIYNRVLLVCKTAKTETDNFSIEHWEPADDTYKRLKNIDDDSILSMTERIVLEQTYKDTQSDYEERVSAAEDYGFIGDYYHEIDGDDFDSILANYKKIYSIFAEAMNGHISGDKYWLGITEDTEINTTNFVVHFSAFNNNTSGQFNGQTINAATMDTIFNEYYHWKGVIDEAIGIIDAQDHNSIKIWETSSQDTGGASVNEFIGSEFDKIGTSRLGTPIWQPKQAAGFRFTPNSAAIQMFFKNQSNQYKHAELAFSIDEENSIAKLIADYIKLEGYTTINDTFGVDLDGNMWAKNGRFGGLVTHEQTVITSENYKDYGVLVSREIPSGVTTRIVQDYYVDIRKCGQHISLVGFGEISLDSRVVLELPFVCDYYNNGNNTLVARDFYSHIANSWMVWDYGESQLVSVNDVTARYIASRELFKARSYVDCVVCIANYTICPMYILGVKGWGQTYYVVNPMTTVSNFEQLISLKCVIEAANFTTISSYAGNEEILWEATSMRPRLVMASSVNTETYYYVGKDEEYKISGHYSEDPLQNEFDQDVVDNYEAGMFDEESNNEEIPSESDE